MMGGGEYCTFFAFTHRPYCTMAVLKRDVEIGLQWVCTLVLTVRDHKSPFHISRFPLSPLYCTVGDAQTQNSRYRRSS